LVADVEHSPLAILLVDAHHHAVRVEAGALASGKLYFIPFAPITPA
jgi:hypothetical protein